MKHLVPFLIFESENNFGLSPEQTEILKKGLKSDNLRFRVSQDQETGKLVIDCTLDLSWMDSSEVPDLNIDRVDGIFYPPAFLTTAKNFPRICRHLIINPQRPREEDVKLNSLEGISENVSSLTLSSTKIKNLDYMPKFDNLSYVSSFSIPTSLALIGNYDLKSLKGCPEILTGNFMCVNNSLTSLEGGPKEVGESYKVHQTGQSSLVSWKGVARKIGGKVIIDDINSLPGEKWGTKMWIRLWKERDYLHPFLISMLEKDWIEDLVEANDPWLHQFLALIWEEPNFQELRDSIEFKNHRFMERLKKHQDVDYWSRESGL
jgi:hypothetical protein